MSLSTSISGREAPPKGGDFVTCINCAGLAIFDENLAMREPTIDEITEIKTSPAWCVVEAFRGFVDRRKIAKDGK